MKPELKYLSDAEIQKVHCSALDILDSIGMRLPAREALAALEKAGAVISRDSIVSIPPALVQQALETVPKRQDVTLFGRDSRHDISFRTHDPALACMTMATSVIDPDSNRKRPATTADLARLVRICDRLEHIAINGGLVTPQEVPGEINDWYTWATCIKNTAKHITGGMLGERCVEDAARMAALALGDEAGFARRPFISGWVLTLPPLAIDTESLEALMAMSRRKIPAIISSGPILGSTAPVTIAGTLAQAHAEILACIVICQLIRPGAPVVYTSFARGMDMQSGNISMACPEFAILKVAMTQMGRFLDLPVRMPAMLRDAKMLDAQAGFETGLVAGQTALGADLMDAMQLDMDMVVDFADPVFCNECMATVKRLARPLAVDDETLAKDIIREVGPGGNYLVHEHTFANFRRELWQPAIMERRNWDRWAEDGSRDIRAVALEKTRLLLEPDDVAALPPAVIRQIDAVVAQARHDLAPAAQKRGTL